MIEIQIDVNEIASQMQQLFPNEYTICVQRVHISKLEAMINEKKENHDHNPAPRQV